jgi:KDO2-lipid IV(A) lauroyltransferase
MKQFVRRRILKPILYPLAFFFSYSILWLITRLPISFLRLFSLLGFAFLYYIFKYRKKVVLQNLRNSFPEWDEKKVQHTAKKFYKNFCDNMIDSVGLTMVNEKHSLQRFKIKNPELFIDLYEKNKSIVCLMAHYGNWELSSTIPSNIRHEVLAIYKPLTNKYFDGMIKSGRERFGVKGIPMNKILRYLIEAEQKNIKTMTLFLADQRPHWSEVVYWTKFLNQEAPFYQGAEKISRKFNMAVVYMKVSYVKRNHYEAEFILLEENAGDTKPHEIMNTYVKLLEKNIKESPEFWLWTHKRWKYVKKDS